MNKMGIGSAVTIWINGKMQMAELTLSRGYESSMEPILYFGTGRNESIDSLVVIWPDGKRQVIQKMNVNQKLTLSYDKAADSMSPAGLASPKRLSRRIF